MSTNHTVTLNRITNPHSKYQGLKAETLLLSSIMQVEHRDLPLGQYREGIEITVAPHMYTMVLVWEESLYKMLNQVVDYNRRQRNVSSTAL